jgi:hypothetical protein
MENETCRREREDVSIWESIMVILVLWLVVLTTYFLDWEYIIPCREGCKNEYWIAPPAHLAPSRTNIDAGQRTAECAAVLQTLQDINLQVGLWGNEAEQSRVLCFLYSLVMMFTGVTLISGADITLQRAGLGRKWLFFSKLRWDRKPEN